MVKAARAHGVEIETAAPVREIVIARDRVAGVALEDGRILRADVVAASVNPKLLYTRMMPADALPAAFRERMERWRCGSGTFRMNVALSRLPRFTALPEAGDHLTSGIILAPSLGYMDRAYQDARNFGVSREPIIEMLIPSTLDDSLAPPGAHVASLFCQHVAPQLPDGQSWDDRRDAVADLMIATVERYAPGFAASVVGRQIAEPARSRTRVRPPRRRYFPRRDDARPIVLGASDARTRRLPRSHYRALSLRRRRPSGRRRHRCAGS